MMNQTNITPFPNGHVRQDSLPHPNTMAPPTYNIVGHREGEGRAGRRSSTNRMTTLSFQNFKVSFDLQNFGINGNFTVNGSATLETNYPNDGRRASSGAAATWMADLPNIFQGLFSNDEGLAVSQDQISEGQRSEDLTQADDNSVQHADDVPAKSAEPE